MTRGPLSKYRVLDLTHARAGPTCVRHLADWGADVISVSVPRKADDNDLGGARHSSDFQNLHRNKRSMTLNLKAPEGLKIFYDMVAGADVIVENFRPDVKERLKIDYETVRGINRKIVYASISGYGQNGPSRFRPGVDQIAQGEGGLMSVTGYPDRGPLRVGIPIADLTAGTFAATGILLALLEREQSGEGQLVQTSLLEAVIGMLDFQAVRWLTDGDVPGQVANDHPTGIPSGVFASADGRVSIAAPSNPMFSRLCAVMGRPLMEDPRFATLVARRANRDVLYEIIEEFTRGFKSEDLVRMLNEGGVPAGPILRIDEVFAQRQVEAIDIVRQVKHPSLGTLSLISQPMTLSRTPSQVSKSAPELGEHTTEVLRSLGMDDAAIQGLRESGIV